MTAFCGRVAILALLVWESFVCVFVHDVCCYVICSVDLIVDSVVCFRLLFMFVCLSCLCLSCAELCVLVFIMLSVRCIDT